MARTTPLFIPRFVSSAFRCCLLVSVVAFLFLARGFAQMLTVGDDTSTPIEGAGHNYIKALSETVNPANGSVSLRISLPMPKGRGIMLPFSISYDTNGIVNLSAPSAIPIWYSPTPGSQFLSSGGWSYGFPLLTSSEWNKTLYDGGTNGNSTVTCEYRAGYIFQDPLGGRHSLALGTTGYQSGSNGHVLCGSPQTAYPDPQFWGVFDEPPSHTGNLLTPVVVSDNDGTRYYFPGVVSQELPNYGSTQQSVRVRILRGFLKSDEFGLGGGQALGLQQQIVHVSITAAAAEQSFDVAVDGFHHTHRYLRPAIVQDTLEMTQQHLG